MAVKHPVIWLVGGGTGGHIVPLIAVAEELQKTKRHKLVFVSDASDLATTLAKRHRLVHRVLVMGKIRRELSFRSALYNLRDIFYIVFGVLQAFVFLVRDKPEVIFSKGGPIALPVAFAAWLYRVPIVLHESDSVMGGTNRFTSHIADKVLTSFPAALFPSRLATKIEPVGLPLRHEFLHLAEKKKPKHRRPRILITTGSLGALRVNQAVAEILPQLLSKYDVVHVTGPQWESNFLSVLHNLPHELQGHYSVIGYSTELPELIQDADIIVSRAGSSIFEFATLATPMVLIPLPSAANNHQHKNAEYFQEHDAAVVILQSNLTPQTLYETIESVIRDKQLSEQLQEGMRMFDSRQSALRVAKILQAYIAR